LRLHPHASGIKIRYVQILIETGKPGRALGIIRKLERLMHTDFQIHFLKGVALTITGKYQEALGCFDHSLSLCNDEKDEIAYNISQTLIQQEQYKLAHKYLLLSHTIDPENLLVLYDLALNYERLNEIQKGIDFYLRYLDIDPFAEHIWNNLGLLYSETDTYNLAIEAFDFAIAINPDYYSAFFNKADLFIMKGKYNEAIDICNNLLDKDFENIKALCCLGDCYEELNDFEKSLEMYNKAIDIFSDCSDAWYGKGMVYYKSEKYSNALLSFRSAVDIDPDQSDYWYMIGESYMKMHKYQMAIEAYNNAVALNPNDIEALLAVSQLLFRKKKTLDAINLLVHSCRHNPENYTIQYYLAAYSYLIKDYNSAINFFEKGLKLNFKGHHEMYNVFPKTKTSGFFKEVLEKYWQKTVPVNNLN